jgi:hypothetical protein
MQSEKLLDAKFKLFNRITFFPVRHHSPAAAYFVRQYIEAVKPACILIEGPSEYNDHISDLILEHELPIAIYSYKRSTEGVAGVFYPFCEHSPEYVAVKCGLAENAVVEFIDLPFSSHIAFSTAVLNDREVGEAEDVPPQLESFYQKFAVNNFNSLWDKLIESDDNLTVDSYLERAHGICLSLRNCETLDQQTIDREAFMAKMVKDKLLSTSGQIMVITGGLHAGGLYEWLIRTETPDTKQEGHDKENEKEEIQEADNSISRLFEFGCTLTPYSDKRLDSYHGYGAGLPCPGFYRQAFEDRCNGSMHDTHSKLLAEAVERLRKKKQLISTADVIVAQQMARGLASLRQHSVVFREDLIDGIASSVVKDEFNFEESHPLIEALRLIFRGERVGRLSSDVALPPLTEAILQLIGQQNLAPATIAREVTCDFELESDRTKSAILHSLATLGISGYNRKKFTGFGGNEKGRIIETWLITESTSFHADCVEAAAWGVTVEEATGNKLKERIKQNGANAAAMALTLLDASLLGLKHLSQDLYEQMLAAIASDNDFLSLSKALTSLLELNYYHNFLNGPVLDTHRLLAECFDRALWLLEYQGAGANTDFVKGIGTIVEIYDLLGGILSLDKHFIKEAFVHSLAQSDCSPLAAGALSGALWKMGAEEDAQVKATLTRFSLPDEIGEFIVGLLHTAGDIIHSDSQLLETIDKVLREFDDDQFLHAAPALRLAFSRYSPREKVLLLRTVASAHDINPASSNFELGGDIALIARVMTLESKVIELMKTHGLRSDNEP